MYSWSDPLFGYAWDFEFFVVAFLFGLGLATLGSGLFTAYFGAGKSQQIGFGLIVGAVLVLGVQYHQTYPEDTFSEDAFRYGLISAVAAMVGMAAGMFVVLFILMKVDTVDDLEDLDLEDLEDLDLDEELKKLEEELAAEDDGGDEAEDDGGDDAPAKDADEGGDKE